MSGNILHAVPTEEVPALPDLITYVPLVSSHFLNWKGLIVERYQRPPDALDAPPLMDHWITLYLGQPTRLNQKRDGHMHHGGLVQGDVTITAAGSSSFWEWDTFSDNLHLGLSSDFLCVIARETECLRSENVEIINNFHIRDARIESIGLALLAELEQQSVGTRLSAEALAQVLAVHVLRHYTSFPSSKRPRIGALSRRDLQQVIAYIQDNLASDLTLAEIASVVALSPYYFCRCFKQATGKSVHHYVVEARVERARLLLQSTDLTIAQIALLVGFSDQSHFTRHFKRILGVTPGYFLIKNRTIFPK